MIEPSKRERLVPKAPKLPTALAACAQDAAQRIAGGTKNVLAWAIARGILLRTGKVADYAIHRRRITRDGQQCRDRVAGQAPHPLCRLGRKSSVRPDNRAGSTTDQSHLKLGPR